MDVEEESEDNDQYWKENWESEVELQHCNSNIGRDPHSLSTKWSVGDNKSLPSPDQLWALEIEPSNVSIKREVFGCILLLLLLFFWIRSRIVEPEARLIFIKDPIHWVKTNFPSLLLQLFRSFRSLSLIWINHPFLKMPQGKAKSKGFVASKKNKPKKLKSDKIGKMYRAPKKQEHQLKEKFKKVRRTTLLSLLFYERPHAQMRISSLIIIK